MQNRSEIYSSKTIVGMVVLFFVLFWILYSIGSFLHESQKINIEIEKIRQKNIKLEKLITQKKKDLAYLKTPQRIEKEAKMQMGKKLPGEQVIIFIEEKIDMLPTEKKRYLKSKILELPNWKKWRYLFFEGDKKL